MKLLRAILLVAICTIAGHAMAQDNHVAFFKTISGTVKVLRSGATLTAAVGTPLLISDEVVTDRGATGGVVFKDGTLLTIGSGTEITIRDYIFEPRESNYAFSIYMAKGSAIYSSGKIGKLSPQSVKVETPRAAVGVRGTRFIITAGED